MNEKRSLRGDLRGDLGKEKEPPPDYPSYTTNTLERPTSNSFRTTFASVSLHMRDRIRLLRFSAREVDQIQDLIKRCWRQGIQETRVYDQSHEIKLRGNPWSPSNWGSNETTEARRLMCSLLEGLFNMGFILKAPVDISKKEFDKDTLIFRKQQPPPPTCSWMCISFDRGDLMHLIDAPKELGIMLVRAYGSKVQSHQALGSIFEIKFRGYPWRAAGTETVQSRLILLALLEALEELGFSLYASIDQDSGPGGNSHASAADVWFCNRQNDWTPGAPVYHS